MLTEKKKKLLDIILKQNGFMKASDYASLLAVSKRTIYSYLDEIEPILISKGIKLNKIPSKGIEVIKGDNKDIKILLDNDDFSIYSRRKELINRLLFEEEVIDIEDFCFEFYVSNSSIRNDINYLKSLLTNYPTVDILINKGKIYLKYDEVINLVNALVNILDVLTNEFNEEEKRQFLYDVGDEYITDVVIETVNDYINTLKLNIGTHYINHIGLVLIVLCFKAKNNHHISHDDNLLDLDKLKLMADVLIAKQFLEILSYRLKIEFTSGDISFLFECLKADRIQISNFDNIDNDDYIIYQRIFKKIENITGIDLNIEDNLVENLLFHLNGMVYRLRRNINIHNPLLDNIKKEFGVLFNLIWLVLESENDNLKIINTEDEVGFIVVHIQNIIQQQKKTKNILLVCPDGETFSNLILNQIRDILPVYNFIETISLKRINEVKLDSIDLIISTVEINDIDKPMVRISPIISKEDIKNITTFYQSLMFENENKCEYDSLCKYLENDLIIKTDLDNMTDIIHMMSEMLYQKAYVLKDYENSVLKRESLGSTDNIYHFAIPHGDIKYVKKTSISIVLLDKVIKWHKYNVNIIIFFNIAKDNLNESKLILEDIFALMKNENFTKLLKEGLSKEAFKEFIQKKDVYD